MSDTQIEQTKTAQDKPDPGDVGFGQALWDFFSSMKTAIVLLLVLALASVIGTVVPQVAIPAEMVQSSLKYRLIHMLSLNNTYGSGWYIGLLILVGLNLTVCSIKRFGAVRRAVSNPKVVVSEKQVSAMQRSEKAFCRESIEQTTNKLETALRTSSYHVTRAQDGADGVIYAVKGRASLWGPYLTHLSLLVIFIGALIGSRLGYSGMTIIKEGGYTDFCYLKKGGEKKLGFRVDLRDFKIGYDAKHNPTSYRSDLKITQDGSVVAGKVIDVNHPLTYRGVTFYQSDFGLDSIVVKVTAPNGQSRRVTFHIQTQDGEYGKQYSITGADSSDMAFQQVDLGGRKLTVYAHDFAPDYIGGESVNATHLPLNPAVLLLVNDRLPEYKGIDAWMKLGWLEPSKSVKYKGYTITLEKAVDYSVLQVAKNPGLPIVYAGFGLILLGVFMSFYVTRKVVRIRITPKPNGSSVLIGGNSRSDVSVFDADFAGIRDSLKDS